MFSITVLSPHRDDAAFSLFRFLILLKEMGCRVRIVNFFTQSAYAPRAESNGARRVSDIRNREDKEVLRAINSAQEVFDQGLLDAPLRLGISASQVCFQDLNIEISPSLIQSLQMPMREAGRDIVLAPLAIGNHIDHISVYRTGLRTVAWHRMAFYEDLPYATWIARSVVRRRVEETEQSLGTRLQSQLIGSLCMSASKAKTVARYRSQISQEEADTIARWPERLWIPAHSARWRALLDRLPQPLGKGPVFVYPRSKRVETARSRKF